MKVIVGSRGSGKTTEAIKLSVKTGNPIVFPSTQQKKMAMKMAEELGFDDLPEPISLTDNTRGLAGDVILDNAEYYLKSFMRSQYGLEVNTVTMTSSDAKLLDSGEG